MARWIGTARAGWRYGLVLLLAAPAGGCRIAYDPLAGDAASDGAPPGSDAALTDSAAAATCDWSDGEPALSAPVALSALDTADGEFDPSLSAAGLTLHYMVATDPPTMYETTRPSLDQPFGPGVLVDVGIAATGSLRLARDELAAVIQVDDGPAVEAEIYLGTRESPDQTLGPFIAVAEVSSPSLELDPFLTGDQLQLWLVSDRGGVQELYVATRTDTEAAFSAPVRVEALRGDPAVADGNPSLTDDQRTIVFASDGTLWFATRSSPADEFGPPQAITALDTADFEWEPTIRGDGCELVFGRMTAGGWRLYRAEVL